MFWRPPDEKELTAFGFRTEDFEAPEVDVWPENWPAIDLYVANRSQWIQGPGGPTGLNYPWFQACLDRQGIDSKESALIMDKIRVIEDAVLEKAYEDS